MSEVTLDRAAILEKFLWGRSAVPIGIPWTESDKRRFPALKTSVSMCGWGIDIAIPSESEIPGKYSVVFREGFSVASPGRKLIELAVYVTEEGEVRIAELRHCVSSQGAVRIESSELFFPLPSETSRGEALAVINGLFLMMKTRGKERKADSFLIQTFEL
jgi:hypothetical protein